MAEPRKYRETVHDHRRPPRPPFDDAPLGLCRVCGKPTPPPLRRWHKDCLFHWLIASDPSFARRAVYLRDRGACAICHKTTEDWEVDHKLRLRDCPRVLAYWLLSNLQTLCRPCHVRKTSEENRAAQSERTDQ